MKVLHFCQMMASLGHEVFHYGVEGSEVADCCRRRRDYPLQGRAGGFFGRYNPDALYEVDWSGRAPYWQLTNERAAAEIDGRKAAGRLRVPYHGHH